MVPMTTIGSGIWAEQVPTHALQKLYRERYLKISQVEFCSLTGTKQPNLSAHENGKEPFEPLGAAVDEKIDAAFDALGFQRWAEHVATSPEEVGMLQDLLDEDSGCSFMNSEQMAALRRMRWKKGA